MDSERSLEELLNDNVQDIKKLSELVKDRTQNLPLDKLESKGESDDLFYTTLDNIFYLRYLLSKKDKESLGDLAENVVAGLEWRIQHLDKPRDDSDQIQSKLAYVYTGDLANGSPVGVLSLRQCDLAALVKIEESALEKYMKYEKERLFQICDKRTRNSNKLVKAMTVVDAKDISMYQGRAVYKVLTSLNKNKGFKPHPQLQDSTILVNAGWAARNVTKGAKKITSLSVDEFHSRFDAKEAVPRFIGGVSSWEFGADNVDSVPPRKSSSIVNEGKEHWKLKKGSSYEWNIDILQPNSIVSFFCDTQSRKFVKFSALLKDRGEKQSISLAATEVNKRTITFPLGNAVGTVTFKVENPGNKVVGKVKHEYKKRVKGKNTSYGEITYRVEVPDDYKDVEVFLQDTKNLITDNQLPVPSAAHMTTENVAAENSDRESEPEKETEDDEYYYEVTHDGKTYEIPEDSYASYLTWLIPYVPQLVTETLIAKPVE